MIRYYSSCALQSVKTFLLDYQGPVPSSNSPARTSSSQGAYNKVGLSKNKKDEIPSFPREYLLLQTSVPGFGS